MTNRLKLLRFIYVVPLFCGGWTHAAELPGDLNTSSTCAVSGRLFEAISAPDGFEIEMTSVTSSIKKKTRLVNGSFEFQAVPAGSYQFRIFDRSGKVIMKRTVELKGTGDLLHFRRDTPLGTEGLVSVNQLKHKENNKATKMFEVGLKAREAGDLQKAVDSFEKAIELDPVFVEARLNLIASYLESKENEKAVDQARSAYQMDPEVFETGYDLGAALTIARHYKEAELVVRSLPRPAISNQHNAELDTLLALSLFGQRRNLEANEPLSHAVAEFPTVRLLAADVLTITNQLDLAMGQVREYVRTYASECERRELEGWLVRAAARQARVAAPEAGKTSEP